MRVTPVAVLYLASTSPRRQELLERAGIGFRLCAPGSEYEPGGGDEHASERGDPLALAGERARRKGDGALLPDTALPVLAVDTVVDLDGRELGKPRDVAQARTMLQALASRRHRVHTAHYLRDAATGRAVERTASALVECGPVNPGELQRYLDSGQWRGKAGSYGVQDDAQGFFRVVEGAYDTVVGLHVAAVRELLDLLRGGAR